MTTKPTTKPTVKTVTFLILGAGGDLTQRLLLPGLGSLLAVEPERDVRVIGADRADLTEALDNTVEIARRCAFAVARHKPILPRFAEDEVDELRRQADNFIELDALREVIGRPPREPAPAAT